MAIKDIELYLIATVFLSHKSNLNYVYINENRNSMKKRTFYEIVCNDNDFYWHSLQCYNIVGGQ